MGFNQIMQLTWPAYTAGVIQSAMLVWAKSTSLLITLSATTSGRRRSGWESKCTRQISLKESFLAPMSLYIWTRAASWSSTTCTGTTRDEWPLICFLAHAMIAQTTPTVYRAFVVHVHCSTTTIYFKIQAFTETWCHQRIYDSKILPLSHTVFCWQGTQTVRISHYYD